MVKCPVAATKLSILCLSVVHIRVVTQPILIPHPALQSAGEVVWGKPSLKGTQPCPRAGHTVNLIANKVYLFGGCGLESANKAIALNDTHCLDLGPAGGDNAKWIDQPISGEPPEGRWRHTATTVDNKIFIFGGLVEDKKRFNDLFVLDTEAYAWRKLNARGQMAAPRAHHSATFLDRKLVIFGGYGGSGRLFGDLEALDVDQLQWSVLATKGQAPKARFDHTASLAGTKLVVFGGRDNQQEINDVNILDTTTMTWDLMKQDVSPDRPVPLYCHVAQAVESAISWKLFTFGGRKGLLEYTDAVYCMDTSNMLWIKPPVNFNPNCKAPCPREYCATVFDPKGARMLFFGGWANCWLGDIASLNVSGIIGPSYAVTGIRPGMGPLSGQREVTVLGINFINNPVCNVKFTNGRDEEIVPGKYLSATEITCTSPSFEKLGAGIVQVKVLIGSEMYTVNKVEYLYYNDTKAAASIAYGPGLMLSRSFGVPASFVLQAKDTKGKNRESGTDNFSCTLILNEGTKEQESFSGTVIDNDNGTYKVSYIPPSPGVYSVKVCLGKEAHIRGSPFPVTCFDPWKRPRLQGLANPISQDRSMVSGNGVLMSFMEGKVGPEEKDPINMFDSNEFSWLPATINGVPPAKKDNNAMVMTGNHLVMFGGRPKGATDADVLEGKSMVSSDVALLTKEKNGISWAWSAPAIHGKVPSAREKMSMASFPGVNAHAMTGGSTCGGVTDLHILHTDGPNSMEWLDIHVEGTLPPGRESHGSIMLGNDLYVFGGKKIRAPRKTVVEPVADQTRAVADATPEAAPEVRAPSPVAEGSGSKPASRPPSVQPPADGEDAQVLAADPVAASEAIKDPAAVAVAMAAAQVEAEEEVDDQTEVFLSDIWKCTIDFKDKKASWQQVHAEGAAPCPRIGHQMDVIDGKVVIYGGASLDGTKLYDLYVYDPEGHIWKCAYNQKAPSEGKPVLMFFNAPKKQLVALDGTSGSWDAVEVLDLSGMLTVQDNLIEQMSDVASDLLKELEDFVGKESASLDTKVEEGDLDRLLKVMGALHDVLSQQESLDLKIDGLTESVEFLTEQGLPMTDRIARLNDMKVMWVGVKKRTPKIKAGIRMFQEREGRKIKHEIARFAEKMEAFREMFKENIFFKYETGAEESYLEMVKVDIALMEVETRRKELEHLATLFECSDQIDRPTKMVLECREDLGLVKVFWDCVAMISSYFDEWKKIKWDDILTESMEDVTKKFKQEVRSMDKKIRQDFAAYASLLQTVNDILGAIPVIGDLRLECMRERHWEQIVLICKVDIDVNAIHKLTFKKLLDMKLHEFVEDVSEIVDRAQKEEKIERNLKMLKTNWADLEFEFTPYNDTELNLVKVAEETFETLEDNQVLVQNMASSRFVGQFQEEVLVWQKQLATVAEVLQILSEIQRTWSYLEDLFIGSDEVKRELPEDAERFVGIDEGVKEVLRDCEESPNLVKRCNVEGFYTFLENLQHQLELCEKSLVDFMEAKRRAFPRFYFVSTKDLLDILSNGNRPEQVMEHIPKIFQMINKLDLKDDTDAEGHDMKIGLGMYDPRDEYVPFAKQCPLSGKVELWMMRVIDSMRDALRTILEECSHTYQQSDRVKVIMEYQGQIVITLCQMFWSVEVEDTFKKIAAGGNIGMMKDYSTRQIDQINALIAAVRKKVTKAERQKIMNIITLDAHARDIIGKVIDANDTSVDCFQWQSQLRYRWDTKERDCFINICDAEFRYAFEYLGNGARLVITPLTDRLYITATQALHMILGCAPAGPAGTGKTETTKDLASQMGLAVYVFNCSDQMDYRSVGDIFKGLASSGSWGCFDEFNRISAEVLSVCSVQYKCVLDAIKAKRKHFNFPGEEELVLNPEVGAFITMNPGYLGRTELPEGLKALFRPVTVMVPDLEYICENYLMAEGYEEAKVLAHKFVILYSLNRDLLSKQMHYDWGLRAIKSVLVVAGAFKRAEPDVSERGLLMRALRDFNIPKIVTEDVVVFMGLITDLFPNLDVPAKRNEELEKIAATICVEQKLQPDENFVLKVCQLEELINIRHCVFLMGPSGTGKTTVYKTLGKAWGKQGMKVVIKDLNPKSITPDELYGVVSLATREWKDGLLSNILRELSRIPDTQPKWLILDGDLDANWIESMNSVMDDNKLLTLASNERIPLLPHMRMLFEIRDLAYATPATVSRAGILFISPSNQWDLYVQTWIDRREDDTKEQKIILRTLFDKYCSKTLSYIKQTFQHLIPILDFNMIQSLCHMLEGLYIDENKFKDCKDKMQYELFFCFAAVWAFGGAYSVKDGEDHRMKFNRWWRNEWRPVKFPDIGTVFDYFADIETSKYSPWSDVTKSIEYETDTPMSAVTVPTTETTGLSFWLKNLMSRARPNMLIGYSGSGKTAIINGVLSGLDPETIISLTINFNYFTDSAMLQKIMEGPLEKKAGKNYAPPGTKKLVYFVDDINMPKVDPYNTQTPIALLRQHFDYQHWFDREKLTQKNIGNCQYVSCMNPSAGSNIINPRLQRHFVTYAIGFPSQDSLVTIYSTFLTAHLKDFEASIFERTTKLIGAGLELHSRVVSSFRKTAVKFHYEFNVRHLQNMFQGILMSQRENIRQPWQLVKLWIHEAERTYGDLLINLEDLEVYSKIARDVTKKYFPNDPEAQVFSVPNIYVHFSHGLQEKVYGDLPNYAKLTSLLEEALKDYNDNFATMDLVLFEDAMKHVCRITRILETGHALLVGVGGSGKQSLSRLASFIAQCSVTGITISRGYSVNNLREDIMAMYVKAGAKNEHLAWIFTDSQITDDKFLVYINDLLASGNIPDLFPPDEKDNMINAVRGEVKSQGIIDSNENCYKYFIEKVVSNLHMILCFSPVGEGFRTRARRFPALVNNAIIDWFHPWPVEALQSVSERFLGDVDLGGEETAKAIIAFMPFSFDAVQSESKKFLTQERRYNYVTPKSFLELIALYKLTLTTKRSNLVTAADRLQVGLDKLQGTAKQVGELEDFLKIKSVEVEQAIAAAETLAEKVGKEKASVGVEAALANVEAEKCAVIKVEVTQKQEDCERDLAAALPAVDKAMASLSTLNKKDLGELKSLKKPPSGIDDVMAAVLVLLSPAEGVVKDKTWQAAVKAMNNVDKFLEKLFEFKDIIDREEVPKANFKAVRTYLKMETFDVETIRKKSTAAAGLCGWVQNITVYYDIVSDVEPKKRMLAEALEQLAGANTKLKEVTEQVASLEAMLAKLESEFEQVMREKEATVAEAEKMKKKMEMAQRLIAALASENVRWTEGVGKIKSQQSFLAGDSLIAASFVSYVGAFTNVYREALMNQRFLPYISEKSIKVTPGADAVNLIANESIIAKWNSESLPTDRVSTENGCIMTSCSRWPLMIDPQLQGIIWIKDRESKNNLQIMRLGQKGFMDRVERAVEGGDTILIENLAESMEASMLPVMARQYIRKNKKTLVKLGDKEVEVHKNFKLVLHTKLSNPHYPPEIQAETTLVNFTVTEAGLQDQLLAKVVKKERPDLESSKNDLIKQQNEFKIKMKEIEDSLLYQLATAEGDLTENIELIENLEESKRVSTDIAEKAKIAAVTEVEINTAFEEYRPVAARSSMLFFMLNNLFRIHMLYLFSLASFVVVFERAIDECQSDKEDFKGRLKGLIENITYVVWHSTRRGAFEQHKLTIATHLTFLIMQKSLGILDPAEYQYLLVGKVNPQVPVIPENIAGWMTDAGWMGLHALKQVPAFSDIVDDLIKQAKAWKLWMEDEKSEKVAYPGKWNDKTSMQKLCIVRCLRPDRVTNALDSFVRDQLGNRYMDEPAFNMVEVFKQSSPENPIFCLLFPGVNPYSDVESAGEKLGFTEVKGNLRRISMGQGQESIAEKVIDDFSKPESEGGWVFLDNVHLMSNWLPTLERKLEVVGESGHRECRVICSAEPHPDPRCQWIPQGILENSVKVVNMPPAALQANLRRAMAQFSQEDIDACQKKPQMRGMLFALCYFHSCVVGRHKFGSQGWSRKYGFNFGDLTISGKVLVNYLNNNTLVPWQDIKYLQGEVMYGGHITDPWDRRVAIAYLDEYMSEGVLKGSEHELQPGFKCPAVDQEYPFYANYIEENFPIETPVLFGLHPNAEIGFLISNCSTLFETILDLSGNTSSAVGGADPGRSVLNDLENRLPLDFNMFEIRAKVENETPYVSVVLQECDRMNVLLGEMRRSMAEVQLGIAGALNMSDLMETLLTCLRLGRVAPSWKKYAYESLKPLALWFEDLLLRVDQLKKWCQELVTPVSLWITALFNPMAYLTAILQTTARQQDLPLDQMDIWTDVMDLALDPETVTEYPAVGMYIHGLCMEGARWDSKKLSLAESIPKELHPEMPMFHVKGLVHGQYSLEGVYQCPVYTTSMRGPTYVFTSTLRSLDKINKWVLAGVCLLINGD